MSGVESGRTTQQSVGTAPFTPSYLEGSSSDELMRFSTARMTPSFVHTPTAVEPSCMMRNMCRWVREHGVG